jgi:hypothetical protein
LDKADSALGDSLLFAIPVKRKDTVIAIVAIDQEPVATVELEQSQLLFLEELCSVASNHIGRLIDADGPVEQRQPVVVSQLPQRQSIVVSRELHDKAGAESVLDTTPIPSAVAVASSGAAIGKKRWWQVWKN